MYSNIPNLVYDRRKSFTLTKEEYDYLLPAKKICGLWICQINDEYCFIGTSEEYEDILNRLKLLER